MASNLEFGVLSYLGTKWNTLKGYESIAVYLVVKTTGFNCGMVGCRCSGTKFTY